jgi:hypothetical protein
MSKADQLFLISLNIHLSSWSLWKMVYRLIQSTPIFLKLLTKYDISCFWSNWLSLFPRLSAGYFAHTSPAEHNELGSKAAFRKRSKSRWGFLRVAIWAYYASSGLSMTLLRFSNTYEFFFMPMTWNCISLWVIPRIVWKSRAIWTNWPHGARIICCL